MDVLVCRAHLVLLVTMDRKTARAAAIDAADPELAIRPEREEIIAWCVGVGMFGLLYIIICCIHVSATGGKLGIFPEHRVLKPPPCCCRWNS